MCCILLLASLLLLGLSAGASAQAGEKGPSFNCSQARTETEHFVCGHDDLAEQDLALDQIYRDALMVSSKQADAIKQEQRRWLSQRDHACLFDNLQDSPDRDNKRFGCLWKLYINRIHALIAQNIDSVIESAMRDPRAALARLQPLHSPLAVAYTDLLTHALSDESIEDFSAFAEALALRHQGPDSALSPFVPISMPCGLVEKYPRLLLVSRPYFGSSLDIILPTITCAIDAYPAEVSAFFEKNEKTMEVSIARCEAEIGQGTMLHAFYRDEWLHMLRLSQFPRSYLTETVTWTDTPQKPWPSQRMLATSDWNGDQLFLRARDALANYYRQQFNLAPADAETAATRALWDNRSEAKGSDPCG